MVIAVAAPLITATDDVAARAALIAVARLTVSSHRNSPRLALTRPD